MAFSFCRLFFWAFMPHLSLWAFFLRHTSIRKEGFRKVLDDKKCWGQRSRPALFFSGQRAKTGTLSYPSTDINLPFKNKGSQMELWKSTQGEAENKEKGRTESKTSHTALQAKPYSLPATCGRGERVNNGLPGQTVKGRGCNTEEGGRFGNAEAPHDDGCNPAHVWNFSFQLYPQSTAKRLTEDKLGMRTVIPLKGRVGKKTAWTQRHSRICSKKKRHQAASIICLLFSF